MEAVFVLPWSQEAQQSICSSAEASAAGTLRSLATLPILCLQSPAGGGRGRGKKKGRQHSDEDFEAEEPDPFKPAKGPGSRQGLWRGSLL
eukprot:1141061-Pelagomonas_calceolata.AAC.9